jgi:hypothetical protein
VKWTMADIVAGEARKAQEAVDGGMGEKEME